MTQKQLSEKIGVHERTIRKWPKRKRQQWQSLAAKGRDVAWFDLLAQLCFEVDAHNAADKYIYYSLELCKHYSSLTCFTNQSCPRLLWTEHLDSADAVTRVISKINN